MSSPGDTPRRLDGLQAGQLIPFGGDRVAIVSEELAKAFAAGDRLIVVQSDGALLHIRADEHRLVHDAVGAALDAFAALAEVDDDRISAFFDVFARRLEDPATVELLRAANDADVAAASAAGRSTTRLTLSESMRRDMAAGLRTWRDAPSTRDAVVDSIDHGAWQAVLRRAPLGVVGFVFEGRPNVFADATGVLRSGNTAVMRIGSDALGTARAIVDHALAPSLAEAGLPSGAVTLVASPQRSTGWALFNDARLSLAVARGSGRAVAQLGAVARQAGVPASLHGTGGAWMVAAASADTERFAASVRHSLDRKVCNTLNVCCIVAERAAELVPVFVDAARAAARARGSEARLHATASARDALDSGLFDELVTVQRADGEHREPFVDDLSVDDLGREWEWEGSPEVSLVVVDDVDAAVRLFNEHSPRLVASLISERPDEHARFYATCDAPFIGDGFTRWVDGQFALDRPELGLSNWEGGRLLGRSAVLSGDSVFTQRLQSVVSDPSIHR